VSEKKIDRGLCLLRLQALVEVVGSSRSRERLLACKCGGYGLYNKARAL